MILILEVLMHNAQTTYLKDNLKTAKSQAIKARNSEEKERARWSHSPQCSSGPGRLWCRRRRVNFQSEHRIECHKKSPKKAMIGYLKTT